jgi:hypothetical protein
MITKEIQPKQLLINDEIVTAVLLDYSFTEMIEPWYRFRGVEGYIFDGGYSPAFPETVVDDATLEAWVVSAYNLTIL